jgi:predicted transcriptional regulator
MIRKCTLSPQHKSEAKGLILSFWAEWEQKLTENEIGVVYRKSTAVVPTPSCLYAYLNRPLQKIVGRAAIFEVTKNTLEECLEMGSHSGYSSEDIRTYAGYCSLYVYHLGKFEVAPIPISVKELATDYGFVPSPQAILLSEDGKRELDARLGYKED